MARSGKRLPFLGGGGDNGNPEGSSGVSLEGAGQGGSDDNQAGGTTGQNAGPVDAGTIDLVAISAKRSRGRPRKTIAQRRADARAKAAGKSAETKEKVAIEDSETPPPEVAPSIVLNVAMLLQFVHGSGSFALDGDEAEALAKAATNVSRYYVKVNLSAKGQAWGALVATAAMIYAPKIMVLAAQRRASKGMPMPAKGVDVGVEPATLVN